MEPASRTLRLVVRCLAVAIIADLLDRRSAGLRHGLELGLGLVALFFPSVSTLLVLCAACLVVSCLQPFETLHIHEYVAAALHGVFCSSAVVALATHRRLPTAPEVLELSRTPLRIITLMVFFAGLAKLNRDFLDPRLSCAGIYYLWVQEWPGLSILPDSDGAKRVVIALTLVGELLGPLLLLARKTRPLGIALLWSLTIGLCTNRNAVYFEFIGLFWTASLFWLDPQLLERTAALLADTYARLGARLRVQLKVGLMVGLKVGAAIVIAVLIELGHGRHFASPWIFGWLSAGLVVLFVVIGAVLLAVRASRAAPEPAAAPLPTAAPPWRLRFLMLLVPIAMLCNEARLYAGWAKSRPTLRMAANLLADGRQTNHYLLSRIPRIAVGESGLTLEPPYPMRRTVYMCGKPVPGKSLEETYRDMRAKVALDRVADDE